jgi:EmrB/QacA subfamily drug resistance transporter
MDKKWWTLLVVCAATFMLLLDVTIVIVALPEIQSGLHTSFSGVQWVIDAYALALAAALLTAGSLADRYGRRLVFSVGLSIFTVGSLLCGVSQSGLMLIASRSLQGIGGASLFATSLALLAHSFRGKDRGIAFGAWGAVTAVATGLGPLLGGVITTGISWRGIFIVNLPIGVAALAVTRWRVEESRDPRVAGPDWAGFGVLTAGLVSLVYGLIRAGELASWSDTGVITCLVLAALFLVAFVAVERRAAHPMFDLSLFKVPTFGGGLAAAFCMNGSLYAMFVYLVFYLQYDLGYSALATGLRLLVVTAGTLVAATLAGQLSSHMPVRLLIGPGLVLVGIGLLLMNGLHGTTSWTHLVPGFIVGGVGSGMVNPPLASTAVGVVRPERAGMASGVNTTFRQIGLATGIAAYGSIFTSSLRHDLGQHLAAIPAQGAQAAEVAAAIQRGTVGQLIGAAPAASRAALAGAIHTSFTGTLDLLLVVSAALALAGAACAFGLIRSRDFVSAQAAPGRASGHAERATGDEGHEAGATPEDERAQPGRRDHEAPVEGTAGSTARADAPTSSRG